MEFGIKILELLVVGGCVVTIAGIISLILNRKQIDDKVGKISFRESMDLLELPVVTFVNNGKKLNFLLDTGASYSSINERDLNGLSYNYTGETGFGFGVEGVLQEDRGYIRMGVKYRNKDYEEEFQVVNLNSAFDIIKQEYGVNLHGILGNSFFQKYRYVLDFDKLIAYSCV